jgi:hypothetical protein
LSSRVYVLIVGLLKTVERVQSYVSHGCLLADTRIFVGCMSLRTSTRYDVLKKLNSFQLRALCYFVVYFSQFRSFSSFIHYNYVRRTATTTTTSNMPKRKKKCSIALIRKKGWRAAAASATAAAATATVLSAEASTVQNERRKRFRK